MAGRVGHKLDSHSYIWRQYVIEGAKSAFMDQHCDLFLHFIAYIMSTMIRFLGRARWRSYCQSSYSFIAFMLIGSHHIHSVFITPPTPSPPSAPSPFLPPYFYLNFSGTATYFTSPATVWQPASTSHRSIRSPYTSVVACHSLVTSITPILCGYWLICHCSSMPCSKVLSGAFTWCSTQLRRSVRVSSMLIFWI